MSNRSVLNPTPPGWAILIPALVLCAVGIATIAAIQRSGQAGPGIIKSADGPRQGQAPAVSRAKPGLATRQAIYVAGGLGAMFAVCAVGYGRIGRWAYPLFALTLAALALLLVARRIDLAPLIPCLLYTSPSPRDLSTSRMPSSA